MKNDECDNVKVKIDAVYFLHHSKINFVKIVPKEKRLMKIFPTAMLPYYAANKLSSSVGVIRRMSNRIDMYDLYFTPDEEGVKCLLNNEGGHQ